MKSLTLLKLGLLATACAGAYGLALVSVDYVENRKSAEARAVLKHHGLDWVSAEPDGMRIVLTGQAPDEASRFRAITVASQITNPAHIRDAMTVPPPEDMPLLAYEVEILRNGNSVLMHGLVPAGPDAPVDFMDRVSTLTPDIQVSDVLTQSLSPVPDTWGAAAELGLIALSSLNDVRVEITAGSVMVDGVAPSDVDTAALTKKLQGETPEGVTLAVNLRQPRQRLSPFTMRLVNDGDGVAVESCAMESQADATRMADALNAAGGTLAADCNIALGAPDDAWPDVAAVAIASLSELGRGAITIKDNAVTVLPDGSVPADVLSAQGDALRAALPPSYRVSLLATKGVTIGEDTGPNLSMTRDPAGAVALKGTVANAQDDAMLASLAAARFGGDQLTRMITIDDDLPNGWGLRALAGTEALALLSKGRVDVTTDAISVTGETSDPNGANTIEAALISTLGTQAFFSVDVVYVAPPPEQEPGLDPRICVADINAVLLDQKIVFAPGSVEVSPEDLETIDAIAAILRDCPDATMEIGGHTDSQGREEMNQLLSQSRAEAILTALASRRVLTGKLSAKGYGETQPIADNSTNAGREANRRIAFRLTSQNEADVEETLDGSE